MKGLNIKRISRHYPQLKLVSILLLLGVTFFAYSPAIDNAFVSWDDQYYVTANPSINQPQTTSLRALSSQIVSLNYHPLTMISLWANAKYSGTESAQPFIITNLIIHLLSTVILFFLILNLSNHNHLIAFVCSAIFALHPMHVESVVWVSERKDVLYSFFFLSSLWAYTRYISRGQLYWILASGGLFILSCLSKAMAVSLVPCLFLIDYISKRDFKSTSVYLEKLPYFLIALLTGLIALDVQSGGDFYGLFDPTDTSNARLSTYGISDRIIHATYANYYYLTRFFIPHSFSPYHPYSAVESVSPLLTGLIGLGFCTLLILSYLRDWRELFFGLAFYLCTIGLVVQLIPVGSAIVAERYTYLPYIGLAYCLGMIYHILHKQKYGWIPSLLIPSMFMMFIIQTRLQSDIWQDHTTLFGQAVERYPDDPYAREYLATGYWEDRDIDSAIYHIKYAINTLGHIKSSAFGLLANCHADRGEIKEAIAYYNEAIRLDDTDVIARYHRGILLVELDPAKAIEDFDYCEQSGNSYVEGLIYSPRGRAHGILKEYHLAIADFDQAIKLSPDDIDNYLDRGLTYEYMGLIDHAKEDYAQVLDRDPSEQLANDRITVLQSLN